MVRQPPGITGVTGRGSADLVGDNGGLQTGGFLRRPMEAMPDLWIEMEAMPDLWIGMEAMADLWIELDTSGAEWRL